MGKAFSKDRVVKAGNGFVLVWRNNGCFASTADLQAARTFTEQLARDCVEDLKKHHPDIKFKAAQVRQVLVEVVA